MRRARTQSDCLSVLGVVRCYDVDPEAERLGGQECACLPGYGFVNFTFMDLNGNGTLRHAAEAKHAHADAQARACPRTRMLSGRVCLLVADCRAGLCSVSEYRTASRDIQFTSELELDRLFRLADRNGDDEITLEEYTNFDKRGSVYAWHCAMCPQNTYKPGPLPSNGRCLPCGANRTSRMGAEDEDECVCDFGYTPALHDDACIACSSGFFKPYPGAEAYIHIHTQAIHAYTCMQMHMHVHIHMHIHIHILSSRESG